MRESENTDWVERLRAGGTEAFCSLFDQHRVRLQRMLQLRMNGRLAERLDSSDVLQETYMDAARRLPEYLRDPRVPVYVWLRGLACERLLRLQRRHLHAQCRAAGRQVNLPLDTSAILARRIMGSVSTPSRAMMRNEMRERVQGALSNLKEEDREIILMRHFEDMSNAEVAHVLNLSDSAASMRYGRALYRLEQLLAERTSEESR